ncbi:hypothetical protein JCM3770_001298 [Rhodotorula araucariae]
MFTPTLPIHASSPPSYWTDVRPARRPSLTMVQSWLDNTHALAVPGTASAAKATHRFRSSKKAPNRPHRAFSALEPSQLVFPSPLVEHRRASGSAASPLTSSSSPTVGDLVFPVAPHDALRPRTDACPPPVPAKSWTPNRGRRTRPSSSGSSTLVGSPVLVAKPSADSLKHCKCAAVTPRITDVVVVAPLPPASSARARTRLAARKPAPLAPACAPVPPRATPPPPRPARSPLRAVPRPRSRPGREDSARAASASTHRDSDSDSDSDSDPLSRFVSARLARLDAFTRTLRQLAGDDAVAHEEATAGATSFDLPALELPWLPTLFPRGAPSPVRQEKEQEQERDASALATPSPRRSSALSSSSFTPPSVCATAWV